METKITPPFHVDEGDIIKDQNGLHIAVAIHLLGYSDFTKTLCRIMNENANALVHAANGEEATA